MSSNGVEDLEFHIPRAFLLIYGRKNDKTMKMPFIPQKNIA